MLFVTNVFLNLLFNCAFVNELLTCKFRSNPELVSLFAYLYLFDLFSILFFILQCS